MYLESNDTKALRFLHIPKTAGSTFRQILLLQHKNRKTFSFTGDLSSDIKHYEALTNKEKDEIKIFLGHAPITTGIDKADNSIIITFLRNPVNRVKSFCQHVSEGKSPYLLKSFPPESFDLERFLYSGNPELSNLQTKMLINHLDCESSLLIDSLSPKEAKDQAINNLFNKISLYGITEYFDESLLLFHKHLNWKIPFYSKKNVRNIKRLIKFQKRHEKVIMDMNSIDIEVYMTAKKRFENLTENIFLLKFKSKIFKLINSYFLHN